MIYYIVIKRELFSDGLQKSDLGILISAISVIKLKGLFRSSIRKLFR